MTSKITRAANGRECMIDESLERWRPVRGMEGLYEISNMGRVRSISRWVNANLGKQLIEGRVLKHSLHQGGYHKFQLGSPEGPKYVMAHRLVAEAFIPGDGLLVRHKDGNPSNNSAENLAWGSHVDNEADKRIHGRVPIGESHGNCKTTEDQVRLIRRMHEQGFSQLRIAKELGVGRGMIGCIVRRETWAHV